MQKLKHLEPCKGSKKFTINDNKNLNSLKLMRMRKILFNRNEPSAHEIRNKQDFNLVIKKYNRNKDYWKKQHLGIKKNSLKREHLTDIIILLNILNKIL